MNPKKTASILKKFLLFNLLVFSVLGLFTFIYLQAIQPNLVKNKSINHLVVIHREKKSQDDLGEAMTILLSKNYGRSKILFGKLT